MKLNERVFIVQQAQSELLTALIDIQKKHQLTLIESACILHSAMGTDLKYALRAERHPDGPDRPAGEA